MWVSKYLAGGSLFKSMIAKNILIFTDFIRVLYKSRYMLRMMTLRELKATYVGSMFGFLWAVISPLAQLVIYGIVFGVFFKSKPDPAYGTDNYLIFLLCGLIPWQFFSQTVASTTGSILSNSNLIKKSVGFRPEVLPIITVVSNIISHLISVTLLLIVIILYSGRIPLAAPVVIVYLFFVSLFLIGLGWIVSGINVFLRDIQQIVGLVLMGWMFLTPVFYSAGIIPAKVLWIMKLNPLYHFVDGYRYALLAGRSLPVVDFTYFAVSSVVMFGVGGMVFRKLKPWFAEVM